MPNNLVGGATVESTVPHSVMGDFIVGNYNLQDVPASGNMFIYKISTAEWTFLLLMAVRLILPALMVFGKTEMTPTPLWEGQSTRGLIKHIS